MHAVVLVRACVCGYVHVHVRACACACALFCRSSAWAHAAHLKSEVAAPMHQHVYHWSGAILLPAIKLPSETAMQLDRRTEMRWRGCEALRRNADKAVWRDSVLDDHI